jgi:hypothetical protein
VQYGIPYDLVQICKSKERQLSKQWKRCQPSNAKWNCWLMIHPFGWKLIVMFLIFIFISFISNDFQGFQWHKTFKRCQTTEYQSSSLSSSLWLAVSSDSFVCSFTIGFSSFSMGFYSLTIGFCCSYSAGMRLWIFVKMVVFHLSNGMISLNLKLC